MHGIALAGARGRVRDSRLKAIVEDSYQHNSFRYTGRCVSIDAILVAPNFVQPVSCPLVAAEETTAPGIRTDELFPALHF